MQKRTRAIPVLTDLDLRFRIMDRYEGYVQVLTLCSPAARGVAGPELAADLARLANDGMAEIVERHPDRFPGFVASLPMNNPDAAVREIDRAIDELGATGVQIFSNVNGAPLDAPEYRPIFERMAAHRLPIWMHPARPVVVPRLRGRVALEVRHLVGVRLALRDHAPPWPAWSSTASSSATRTSRSSRTTWARWSRTSRGGPAYGLDQLGTRTDDPDDLAAARRLTGRPVDHFRMFYGDTALFGASHAMECGLAFFGADHVLFGTDMPFDPERGPGFIRETIAAMERMRATAEEKAKIYEGNARRMLRLRLS